MVVEADDQPWSVLEQHPRVARQVGQPPPFGTGAPLSMPVDGMTPMTLLRQAMTFAPHVRCTLCPGHGALDHDQLLA